MTRAEAVWHANHVFNIVIERCINAQNLKEAREFDEAKQIVIEALGQEPKWIPVTERLPEEGLTVLILAENGHIEFGQRDENKWEWLAESIADYWTEAEEVIAWQPLPEPYEESDGE